MIATTGLAARVAAGRGVDPLQRPGRGRRSTPSPVPRDLRRPRRGRARPARRRDPRESLVESVAAPAATSARTSARSSSRSRCTACSTRPRDAIVWDTGHQAYVHKLVTGRREGFARLRQAGGLSGYPSRSRVGARPRREQSRLDRAQLRVRARGRRATPAARRHGTWSRSSATARSPAASPTRRSTTSAAAAGG